MYKILAVMETESLGAALAGALGDGFAVTVCAPAGADPAGYDALITELCTSGATGLELPAKHPGKLAVLALTPVVTQALLDDAPALGIGCLVRVPCTPAHLADRLRDLLVRAQKNALPEGRAMDRPDIP